MKKIVFTSMLCSLFFIALSAGARKIDAFPHVHSFLQATDPWIINAYRELYGRQPNVLKVNIHNYNNGSWSSYPELKGYVQAFQNSLRQQNIKIVTGATKNGQTIVGLFMNGQLLDASIVAQGGGNIVAQEGGNLVGPSGGTFQKTNATAGFSVGSSIGLLAGGTRRIVTSPKSAFIIK